MKRLVIGGAVAALLAGGVGLSAAGEPGPNGHNNWGLCNAYAHNGQNNNGVAFQRLEAVAHEADEADGQNDYATAAEEVFAWCEENGQKPGNGGKKNG